MNTQDKRRPWTKWLKEFLLREYRTVLLWTAIGALCAGALRLISSDHAFHSFLFKRYTPEKLAFDDPKRYFPYGLSAALSVAGIALALIVTLMRRGLRSWWFGVTSGLSLLTFLATVTCLSMTAYSFTFRLLAYFTFIAISFAAGLALYCRAKVTGARLLNEQDLKVSLETKKMAGSLISESDEPTLSFLMSYNTVMLPDLLKLYRRAGFTFISLPQAASDPAYALDPDLAIQGGGTFTELVTATRKLPYPPNPKPYKQLANLCLANPNQ